MFVSGHRKNDLRSLWLHQAIAEKLRADSVFVLRKARANLDRWRGDANSAYYIQEWDSLLSGPIDRLLEVLTEDSEYATALRHTSPFAGVLTSRERWAIYRAFKEEERLDKGAVRARDPGCGRHPQ